MANKSDNADVGSVGVGSVDADSLVDGGSNRPRTVSTSSSNASFQSVATNVCGTPSGIGIGVGFQRPRATSAATSTATSGRKDSDSEDSEDDEDDAPAADDREISLTQTDRFGF